MKRFDNQKTPPFHPVKLWLEQYWQAALVTEELACGCLAVLVQQAPPLVIRHPFIFTLGAVEAVGFLSNAAPRRARKFGIGSRCH